MIYKDRQDAGKQLAEKLKKYTKEHPIVIGLPRGGVVLGYEIAKALKARLDVIVPRKIGAPYNPEFGIGTIAPNLTVMLNTEMIKKLKINEDEIKKIIKKETAEMKRRTKLYRKNLPEFDLVNRTVIIVDDGIATGASIQAAVLSIKLLNPKKIILAVPVCPSDSAEKFGQHVDEFICLSEIPDFYAVGAYYNNFEQVTDEEVINLIQKSKSNFE